MSNSITTHQFARMQHAEYEARIIAANSSKQYLSTGAARARMTDLITATVTVLMGVLVIVAMTS